MKFVSLALMLAFAGAAHADGTRGQQAAAVVKTAVALFEASYSPDAVHAFTSVEAVRVGHEDFQVKINMGDQFDPFVLRCLENESTDPVTWDCKEAR
ncbi:MAG: hypothetical protein AB7F86_01425 [Bdellovibrionales bacterium]